MRHLASSFMVLALAAAVLMPAGGCTNKGDGLIGAGPDDRTDRGGGPDTVAVFATADTYYERTIVDDGSHILAGSKASIGLEAVSFLSFGNLPAAEGDLEEAFLVLYTDAEIIPSDDYNLRISRLEEAPPSEAPFWPGPPDGADFVDANSLSTREDTTSSGAKVYFISVELPADWISGWIDDPASNFGLRISGGTLNIGASGTIHPAFRRTGQYAADLYSLAPRLETKKTGQTDPSKWTATKNSYIYSPTLGPVGDLPSMRLGGVFGYRILLRFPIEGFSELASVNKALLTLKIDKSQPTANQGLFNVVARPAAGEWSEDSTNVDVKLDAATTPSVEVDADDDSEVELDVTALVELFAEGNVFNVAVLRSTSAPTLDGMALLTSDGADTTDAPFLRLVFTTPPGGRF